jgi:hypothetical protein
MRSISRRKFIFWAGFREELKGDLENSALEEAVKVTFAGATDLALVTALTGTLADLGAVFEVALGIAFRVAWRIAFFAATLEATGRAAFFAAVFLVFEGRESVRGMILHNLETDDCEEKTIPKFLTSGKPEAIGQRDNQELKKSRTEGI